MSPSVRSDLVAASRHRPKPALGAQHWAKRQTLAELEDSLAAAAPMTAAAKGVEMLRARKLKTKGEH
jgi:hypothetical protein